MNIGFIGTGVMGSSIIKHLLNADYNVNIYTRTKNKATDLLEKGAQWKNNPKEIVEVSDLIFTMVGSPEEVDEVYFGEDGLFVGISSGKTLIDMTTSTPTLAMKIAEEAKKLDVETLDAPVTGGDKGAQKGTLTIMVGGEEKTLKKAKPILETFANKIKRFGPVGSGQHAKMTNQIMVAGTMTGMIEMFAYAEKANLDLEAVVNTVSGGAAQNRSLDNYGSKIIVQDYTPSFFVKHFLKDLKIALEEAERMDLELPATKQAYELYHLLAEKGYEYEGTQALIKLWWNQ